MRCSIIGEIPAKRTTWRMTARTPRWWPACARSCVASRLGTPQTEARGGPRPDTSVGRMFAVLGAGEALARLLSFAGTVWIARRMGADAYGIIAVAVAVVSYFNYVADYSVEV